MKSIRYFPSRRPRQVTAGNYGTSGETTRRQCLKLCNPPQTADLAGNCPRGSFPNLVQVQRRCRGRVRGSASATAAAGSVGFGRRGSRTPAGSGGRPRQRMTRSATARAMRASARLALPSGRVTRISPLCDLLPTVPSGSARHRYSPAPIRPHRPMLVFMARKNGVLSVVVSGAAPAVDVGSLVKQAIERGWTVQLIATPSALAFFDAAEIEGLTRSPVRSQHRAPGAPRSRVPDAIVVAPATFNLLNQWALGVADSYALAVLAEQTGMACRSSRCPRSAPRSRPAPSSRGRSRRCAPRAFRCWSGQAAPRPRARPRTDFLGTWHSARHSR